MHDNFVVWLDDFDLDPVGAVQSTAKHIAKLKQAQFPVIPGFVITSYAYSTFLKENNLDRKLRQLLSTIAIERPESLMQFEHHSKKLFEQARLSKELQNRLLRCYYHL